jgi:tRNA (guanine-N7-)-methyltransferase
MIEYAFPITPQNLDWGKLYPAHVDAKTGSLLKKVTVADVGCGFGGLLKSLSPVLPGHLILGLEIRMKVAQIVADNIASLRGEGEAHSNIASVITDENTSVGNYDNISVIHMNIMKNAHNYFEKGQLEKMFFLFGDPHFKKSNFRRRVINPSNLSVYAYIMKPGGIVYTITDVKDLHDWMVKHLEGHPMFERIPEEQMANDPCVPCMYDGTDEGRKVTRLGGNKYASYFRRIKLAEEDY